LTAVLAVILLALAPAPAVAQSWSAWIGNAARVEPAPASLLLVRGTSDVVDHGAPLERVSIADPEIADAVVVSATEVVINGKKPGQTTLFLWDREGGRARFQIFVTVDAPAVQEQIRLLLPETAIRATASGNTIILSGDVLNPGVEERVIALATALAGEAQILNQMVVPDRGQVMLKVRFAEVNRNALKEFGLEAAAVNGGKVAAGLGAGQIFTPADTATSLIETSQDAVNFFLFHKPSDVSIFLRALQSRGLMRSLAEPTLMAVPGGTATFLAGGEFPFPVLQNGSAGNAVTIEFKEFGIRLNFVPTITNSGAIRIQTAPEVSQLDFTQGLEVSGYRIPALLTRRAETMIELSSGQTFAIAGLVDNSMTKLVNKVPLLGDIPILGALFRSEEMRQNRSELLVLVTPHIVRPTDGPPPALPTGEPDTWEGMDQVREPEPEQQEGSGEDEGGAS
jgi:pilus assembly protein CpaC